MTSSFSLRLAALILALGGVTAPAMAQNHDAHAPSPDLDPAEAPPSVSELSADDAWIRVAPPNAGTTAGYATFVNDGDAPLVIVGASSEIARSTMLHSMREEDGMMRMRHMSRLEIPANGEASLQPGGDHLMLVGIDTPLAAGQRVVVTFQLEDGRSEAVTFSVRDAAP